MSWSSRTTAARSGRNGRFSSLPRVFLMSALGALILGAAFWPPYGFERRMSVSLVFDEGLSDEERRDELSRIEATVADADRLREWTQCADAEAKPRSFVWTQIASFAPAPTRAEQTVEAASHEVEGKLASVEIRFADSDSLRAERFARAIAITFDAGQTDVPPANVQNATVASDVDAQKLARELKDAQREQEELQRALDAHFEELRSLRSKLSESSEARNSQTGAVGAAPFVAVRRPSRGVPLAPPVLPLGLGFPVGRSEPARALAKPVAPGSSVSLIDERTTTLSIATAKNFLWQAPAALSRTDVERQLKALDAEIAAKKASREELLAKFTIHHPVATALGIAIERLERERKELTQLLETAGDDPIPAPPAIPPAATPAPAAPRPSAFTPKPAPAPSAPTNLSPDRRAVEQAAAERKAEERRKEAERLAAENAAAEKAAAESAAAERAAAEREHAESAKAEHEKLIDTVEAALAREATLQAELAAFAETSQKLAGDARANAGSASSASPAVAVPASVHAEIVDRGSGEGIFERLGALALGSFVFALAMTGLAWLVGRERPVTSADEVRFASGLPVIGQASAGLLDRKPRRNVAAFAVGGAQKLIYGAAFATAVFCVAALAAENPRCLQILRQPLAVAWQALESLT